MDPLVVVGAGIAGVACARVLAEAGLPVRVLDRGKRVGGRMASRRVGDRPVDLGASYLTASDPDFLAVVEDWRDRGLARPWTDTFGVLGGGPTSGPMRWGSAAGIRSLVEDLAAGLDVRRDMTVQAVRHDETLTVDGQPAAAVVLAMPDPQAHRLLDEPLRAALPPAAEFEPVLALAATWPERRWDFDGLFVNDDPVIAWVADDGRRRGDGAPVLVAHSTTDFAAEHLTDPVAAAEPMIAALGSSLGLPAPAHHLVQRWSFARPAGPRSEPYGLSLANVGLCGDGWSEKPRVEAAYLSGRSLGVALRDRLA